MAVNLLCLNINVDMHRRDIQRTVHRDISYNKKQRDALFLKFVLV